jgi:hypothetical protein
VVAQPLQGGPGGGAVRGRVQPAGGAGQLEDDQRRVDADLVDGGPDPVGEIRPVEVARGDVDADPQRVRGHGAPLQRLPAGAGQHLQVELGHQLQPLGQRDELGRREQAAGRVVPAGQSFDGDQLAPEQIHDRLVVDVDPVPPGGAVQGVPEQIGVRDRDGRHVRAHPARRTACAALVLHGFLHGSVPAGAGIVRQGCRHRQGGA